MNLNRRSRKKPWMAKGKGRNVRSLEDGTLQTAYKGSEASLGNKLYKSSEWAATRLAVLERDPICQWCIAVGLVVESTDADHIIPSRYLHTHAEFFDQENIVGSCRSCNSRRASYEAKGVYYETKKEWQEFLRRKFISKNTRT
jgi:5-methylcytosine-specific restriction endonuclease McrA